MAQVKTWQALALAAWLGTPVSAADSSVWVLQGKSNRVYLAGSIHLLKPGQASLPPELERAYSDAEKLVFELDLDDIDPSQVAAQMMQTGMRSDGNSLSSTLPAADAQRLRKAAESLGLPVAMLEQTEPWLASLLLTSMSLVQQGYSPDAGIDQQVATRAQRDRKPIDGLETAAEQFAAFDSLSAQEQQALLQLTLEELEDGYVDLSAIEQAWRRGDQQELNELLRKAMASAPTVEAALLIDRNRRWLPAIQGYLRSREDILVVVGAAHLVGERSVIEMLRGAGLTVTPLARQ
jgi:hypothetical protein